MACCDGAEGGKMNRNDYVLYGAKQTALRGEQLAYSKLKEVQVMRIRAIGLSKTARELAAEYGVHHRTIEKCRDYVTWTHLP